MCTGLKLITDSRGVVGFVFFSCAPAKRQVQAVGILIERVEEPGIVGAESDPHAVRDEVTLEGTIAEHVAVDAPGDGRGA
jgi:hypothetical protein